MKLVLVEWVDAFAHTAEWAPLSSIHNAKPVKCIACGILAEETEDAITVYLSHNEHNYAQALTIPRGCVKKMWKLKV
ncbi:unnamed protein product [marine sediment metagenome]|uniref:Uncharacterized protein n=1 Tax=marine sediment metagenome TaxID=412755 RepID=X1CHD2_9ZZZZ